MTNAVPFQHQGANSPPLQTSGHGKTRLAGTDHHHLSGAIVLRAACPCDAVRQGEGGGAGGSGND